MSRSASFLITSRYHRTFYKLGNNHLNINVHPHSYHKTHVQHLHQLHQASSSTNEYSTNKTTKSTNNTNNNANDNTNNNDNNHAQHRKKKEKELSSSTTLSLAPMMEYTDRHFRYLVRSISSQTLLYTEMVAANAIVHERMDQIKQQSSKNNNESVVNHHGGKRLYINKQTKSNTLHDDSIKDISNHGYDMSYLRRYLGQSRRHPTSILPCSNIYEGPSVLQIGGSDVQTLYDATRTVMELTSQQYCDYTAINLNCGCPSPKVAGKGCFGAALMNEPTLVKELVTAMDEGCNGALPITVKCRIGTDEGIDFTKTRYNENASRDQVEYSNLCRFIEEVASSNVVTDFQIHARIAVLNKKFSPADNRKVPTLKYHLVRRLCQDYPELSFSLNGGIQTIAQAKEQLDLCPNLKGIMIGRAWSNDPWSFAMADQILYNKNHDDDIKVKNRLELLKDYGKYADAEEMIWDPTKIRRFIIKAVTPLFAGEPKSKRYRIALDDIAGIPKKMAEQGKSLEGMPPLSELIVNAAMDHLDEDVLLRTREESYERMMATSLSNPPIHQ